MTKQYVYLKTILTLLKEKFKEEKGEIGFNQIVGIAIGLIVVAFVTLPLFRTFGTTVLTALSTWFTTKVAPAIFPGS